MIRLFLKFEIQKIISYFKTGKLAKLITASLFVAVFIFVGVGLYYFFLSGFRYIHFSVEKEIQLPLTLFIYELFLLIMAAVVVFSAAVSSVFSLFRGQYDNWIISSPKYKILPRIVFLRSLLTSSWPLFVMFLPAVLAFNKIHHLSAVTLFFILVSVVFLLILLNALSLLSILLVSSLYYKLSRITKKIQFTFGRLITLLFLIVTAISIQVWNSIRDVDLVKLFKADDIDINVSIENISSHFFFSPTHPLALQIINWQEKLQQEALINFSFLALLATVAVFVWWKVSIVFYPLWQKFQEGSVQTIDAGNVSKKSARVYYFSGSPMMALFKKEALITSRNLRGVVWFLFLLGLWLTQVGTNIILSQNITRYQTDVTEKLATFQALQFIIAVYFICSFALRFVFPSFSVEKKTAWILGSAPLNFRKIFFGKYFFYTTFFVILGSLMSYVNARVLNLDIVYSLYSISLFVVTVIFIVTLALSLGALFPSKETDDPEAISTSMSGLFFTALSLIYGALSAYVLYLTLTNDSLLFISVFILVTCSLIAVMLRYTPIRVSKKII